MSIIIKNKLYIKLTVQKSKQILNSNRHNLAAAETAKQQQQKIKK